MSINGRKLKVQPHTNKGDGAFSEIMIVAGDIVTAVSHGSDAGGWITVRRDRDGLIDTGPAGCFKYLNNKPVQL